VSQRSSRVLTATLVADCFQIENTVTREVYRRKGWGLMRSSCEFDEGQAERCDEKERDGSQYGRAQPLSVEPGDVGLETHGGKGDR